MPASLDELLAASRAGRVIAYGLTPAFSAHVCAQLSKSDGPVIVVAPDQLRARQLANDIGLFLGSEGESPLSAPPALLLLAPDTSPYAELSADRGLVLSRMTALYRLARGGELVSRVIVTSAAALIRRTLLRDELLLLATEIAINEDIDRDDTARLLERAGYTRVSVVEDAGTYAVRGGVLDVFAPIYAYPIRIELFGDTVESLRTFDPSTQRTLRALKSLVIHPVRETIATTGAEPRVRILAAADTAAHPSASTRRILEAVDSGSEFVGIDTLTPAFHVAMEPAWAYLPSGDQAQWFVLDPDAVQRAANDELEVAERRYHDRIDDHRISFEPLAHYAEPEQLRELLQSSSHCIEARSLEMVDDDTSTKSLRFNIDDNHAIRSELERTRRQKADELVRPLLDCITNWRADGWRVGIVCDGASRRERLVSLLAEYGVPTANIETNGFTFSSLEPAGPVGIIRGRLSSGFALPADRSVLITDDDIFGERRRTSSRQRAAARRAHDALLGSVSDFSQLAVEDYLVHQLHGVGVYKGLQQLPVGGTPIDFLEIHYVGGTLYLPVYRLSEVQRYVGADGHKPRVDKLGGISWAKSKSKASHAIRALAEELLQLYAQRAARPGHAYPASDSMFREFEATFEFEETPDQQRAIDDVIEDMESSKPMDRLVCGDVGYGKTEVALRAMLKAILGGKQVAMLAPTTVLVEQHFQTMTDRFRGWPINCAKLSRFQKRADQLSTIKGLADGTIDAVVGTHRLLSKDVRFKDLGLLIIDEEQRFGVAHKERLKKLRTQVDVLTLTATPIPRTLHLAMTGMRDLSIIATPPADRRSIRTFVSRVDDGVIREGIRRELARGGQVFFVVPRIGHRTTTKASFHHRSLGEWADHLKDLVPEARVVTAHGQLPAMQLEKVMVDFVAGKSDVLVSTTIVESGLDIGRANTMFIARANTFGLAQLYQLRGRIGRSKERAFCYLLVPSPELVTDDARKRLETLQRFTDLGAGFAISSQDLELRGGGELLGAKQSGTIAAIGFDAYVVMLEDAVAELRGEEIHRDQDPELNVEVPGFIPDDYVPDTGQRLDLYKRLSSAESEDDVTLMLDEIQDRYGPLPHEVTLLGSLMSLKVHARRLRAVSLDLTRSRLSLAFGDDPLLTPEQVLTLVNQPNSCYRLTPDMQLRREFTAAERAKPIEAARRALLELVACAT